MPPLHSGTTAQGLQVTKCSSSLGDLVSVPQVGRARFRAPELLFHPHLVGEEGEGIHEVLAFAIQKSDLDLRKIFYSNIVLSGGSTLFRGLSVCLFLVVCLSFYLSFIIWVLWNGPSVIRILLIPNPH